MSSRPGSAPISHHRLFPAAVALWFGALFGLSSLAVRVSLIEQLILNIHFDQFVPAASPPLGHVARLLIALVFALIGAGIGLTVARLVAGPPAGESPVYAVYPAPPPPVEVEQPAFEPDAASAYRVRPRDAHPDAPARRPISAHEELRVAEERYEGPGWSHSDPLPVDAPEAVEPVEPAPSVAEPGTWARPEIHQLFADHAPAEAAPAEILTEPRPVPVETPPEPASTAAERIAEAPTEQLSPVELVARLGRVMHQRTSGDDDTPVPAEPLSAPDRAATIKALRAALAALGDHDGATPPNA
jgi:hypothetical protein